MTVLSPSPSNSIFPPAFWYVGYLKHFSAYTTVTFRKVLKSNSCKSELSTHVLNYVHLSKGLQLQYKLQHTGT